MYHSHLLINVGDNPDRPDWNITRRWLRNLYRVHQRLCMAFPSSVPAKAERIAAYCAPFGGFDLPDARELPGEPDSADVHHERSDRAGFLFRIDHPVDPRHGRRRPVIVVQSTREPDWDLAFGLDHDVLVGSERPIGNAGHLLAARPLAKPIAFELDRGELELRSPRRPDAGFRVRPGDRVRFRLRANAVRTVDGKRYRPRIDPADFEAGQPYRDLAFEHAHKEWLARKLNGAASDISLASLTTGWSSGWRTKHEPQPNQRMQWWSALFEGDFLVDDPSALRELLISGIGPAKAFGFGLLSVAPIRS